MPTSPSRARSLLRGGKSSRAVSMALRQKGVADDHIRAAFERLEEEQMEEEGSSIWKPLETMPANDGWVGFDSLSTLIATTRI